MLQKILPRLKSSLVGFSCLFFFPLLCIRKYVFLFIHHFLSQMFRKKRESERVSVNHEPSLFIGYYTVIVFIVHYVFYFLYYPSTTILPFFALSSYFLNFLQLPSVLWMDLYYFSGWWNQYGWCNVLGLVFLKIFLFSILPSFFPTFRFFPNYFFL